MKSCAETWLVALDHELPADPGVAYSGTPPIIGCSHMVCSACGAVVRHADGRSTTSNHPPVADKLRALYESATPESSPLLDGTPLHVDSRTYFCRCDWYAVNLGGARWVDDIDQPWSCAGHPDSGGGSRGGGGGGGRARAIDPRHAAAQQQVDALVAATVPVSVAGAKIRFHWAVNVDPAFATASELRDSLLASYPDAAYFGGPVVGRNRDDTAPAWGWAIDLIRTRTDWWPALGIALQHAVAEGGDLARTAFAVLLADFRDSLALLPWTSPVAGEWPDVRATGSGTGWGMPDFRLATIVRDQEKSLAEIKDDRSEAFLDEYGRGGAVIRGPFTNEADLRTLLTATARAGQFPDGVHGPWSWLGFELLVGDAWLRPGFLRVATTIDLDDVPSICALLDWFSEERDLREFVGLLEGWVAHAPAWWATPAGTKPKGWRHTLRSSHWPEIQTLGDIAVEALRRAKLQVATPPIVDLPVLFGPDIS